MKKQDFFKDLFTEKRVYVMAAVTLVLTAVAIGVVYSRSMSIIKGSITTYPTEEYVRQNQTGEADPRTTAPVTSVKTEATEKETSVRHSEATTAQSTQATEKEVSFLAPADGEIITEYSPDVPLYSKTMSDWRTHHGIDIALKENAEIISIADGKVSKAYYDTSFGYVAEIDHGDFTARYCGLDQESAVKINQLLSKGDAVGNIGTVPCEQDDGAHLHFEIVKNGINIEPKLW